MIVEAIGALKERTGSSQYAIAKYLEDKYKTALPPNFKKTLTLQLRNLTKAEKLVKVKNSFKLSEELKKPAKAPGAPKAAVKVVPKAKVAKKPSAAGAKKTKTAGAKSEAPSAKATKAAKPKTVVKASAPAAKKAKTGAVAKKAAPAAGKKAAPAVVAKKPAGRKPPTVRKMVTPKKGPKTVKAVGAKAKTTTPATKAKTAKAGGSPAKKAKK